MNKKNNITLIGMPGAGKSTIGIILAKYLSFGFIDTDVLIQINHQKSLQQIMDETGYLNLREIEESGIRKINIEKHIIATGGSAVYSDKAMQHLQSISTVIFLKVAYEVLKKRIHNFKTRGIAKSDTQSFQELYDERQALYNRYGEIIIDCSTRNQEEIAEIISDRFLAMNRPKA
ncbi:MAG: shikimate kinase [Desulfobacteraceae bacterium]|nr:shikimate kinase [Desulfobacteraceae bacterium]MBC2757596.1 shikimate kinase [Desulfobacteraceae bacterium]